MSENIRKAITLVNSCSYIVTAKKPPGMNCPQKARHFLGTVQKRLVSVIKGWL